MIFPSHIHFYLNDSMTKQIKNKSINSVVGYVENCTPGIVAKFDCTAYEILDN